MLECIVVKFTPKAIDLEIPEDSLHFSHMYKINKTMSFSTNLSPMHNMYLYGLVV